MTSVDVTRFGVEMRTEKCRNQLSGGEAACCRNGLEGTHLGFRVEPVARLDLDRRRAAVEALAGALRPLRR